MSARDERSLKIELDISLRLGRKLQRMLLKEMPTDIEVGVEFLVSYLLFLRAERSLAAVRTLVRAQLVDDAFAVVRVLVERILNGEFILLAGMEPAMDFIQYEAFREWRDFVELQKALPELATIQISKSMRRLKRLHDEARTRIRSDGTQEYRYGRGHDWNVLELSKRADEIDDMVNKKFSTRNSNAAQVLYATSYKFGTTYIHGMWASLKRSLEFAHSQVQVRLNDGSPRVAIEAMTAANFAALSLVMFLDKVLMSKKSAGWLQEFTKQYFLRLKQAGIRPSRTRLRDLV